MIQLTDSVIYISREGEYDIPLGNFVGEMTDELAKYGENSYIDEFVGAGPKNYAYKAWSTDQKKYIVTCKVKGIRLNHAASQKVNFDSIKKMMVDPEENKTIYVDSNQIRRTKEHAVITRPESKIYRPLSVKRRFTEDFDSYPYGFKRMKLDNEEKRPATVLK